MDPPQDFSIWYCVKHDDGFIVEGNDYPYLNHCFNETCELDFHGHFKYTRDYGIFQFDLLHSLDWYESVAVGGFKPSYFASNIYVYNEAGVYVKQDDDHLATTFRGCVE